MGSGKTGRQREGYRQAVGHPDHHVADRIGRTEVVLCVVIMVVVIASGVRMRHAVQHTAWADRKARNLIWEIPRHTSRPSV